jgi:hypothetical protein
MKPRQRYLGLYFKRSHSLQKLNNGANSTSSWFFFKTTSMQLQGPITFGFQLLLLYSDRLQDSCVNGWLERLQQSLFFATVIALFGKTANEQIFSVRKFVFVNLQTNTFSDN